MNENQSLILTRDVIDVLYAGSDILEGWFASSHLSDMDLTDQSQAGEDVSDVI